MKGQFLLSQNEDPAEGNIYADKSSLILDWLLQEGSSKESFSLREIAKERQVSVGLVQRVCTILVTKGLLEIEGVRTAKRFSFKKGKELLQNWLEHYSIIKKCKIRTYRSALPDKANYLKVLKKSGLCQHVAVALHSAAEVQGYKNTNLEGLELYMFDPLVREKLESTLELEPQEKGYEVLLIEPYYKMLIQQNHENKKSIRSTPILLTFLDLYHFPLRGIEQAEYIASRAPIIKQIYQHEKIK